MEITLLVDQEIKNLLNFYLHLHLTFIAGKSIPSSQSNCFEEYKKERKLTHNQ